MEALVWHGDRELAVEQLPEPELAPGHVLVDISLAGVCGSDLHGYRGHPGPRVPPLVLGHEAVGTVRGQPGRVVPFPLAHCGRCAACRRGEEQLCPERGLLGLDRAGVFARCVAVPADAVVAVPDDVPDEVAVLTEPYAVAIGALAPHDVAPGQEVLVIGSGPIGALTVHAAVSAGARVSAVDPLAPRRELAAALGAAAVHEDAARLPGGSFDLVVDAVGIEPTWRAASEAVRRGGAIVIVGLGAETVPLTVPWVVRDAITVRGHFAYTRAQFELALQRLAGDPPPLDWIKRMPLDDGAEAFRELVDEPERVTKVVLEVGAASA